jgi:hypothetical protein
VAETSGRSLPEAMIRQPRPETSISVIVPVHNNPGDLRLCLGALRAPRADGDEPGIRQAAEVPDEDAGDRAGDSQTGSAWR